MPLGSTWSVAINGRVRDDVAADLSQPALLTDRHGRLVEGHAAADRHEVALAGRCRLRCAALNSAASRLSITILRPLMPPAALHQSAKAVACWGNSTSSPGVMVLEASLNDGDVDGLGAHTADRGGTARPWFAYLADPGPDAARTRRRRRRRAAVVDESATDVPAKSLSPLPSAAPTFGTSLIPVQNILTPSPCDRIVQL